MRRDIHSWLEAYGESHQNAVNKAIHWVCVPLIMLSLIALLAELPLPGILLPLFPEGVSAYAHWGALLLLGALLYYLSLSLSLSLGMLGLSCALLLFAEGLSALPLPRWQSALGIFIAAWVGQFIGHHIEGKKPSFLEDIQFLLIGPLWLMSFIYRVLRIPL